MLLKQGYYQSMVKNNNILIPIRFATRHELHKLICGAIFCPACDCQLMGEDIMNKMPVVSNLDTLEGWMCDICDSVFDLQDKIVDIGEFDLFNQEIAVA
jgi:hypothetical protein